MSSMASRSMRGWWSWRRARTCWSMTRNTRPRNCRNGADGDTAASIKRCNLRKWPAQSAWPSRITIPNTTTSFLSASKNCVRNGSLTRCSPAKEWKSRSRTQPEAGSSREGGRAGSCVNGRHYHRLRVSAIIGPWSYRRCWYFLIASSNECVAFSRCAQRRTLVSTH